MPFGQLFRREGWPEIAPSGFFRTDSACLRVLPESLRLEVRPSRPMGHRRIAFLLNRDIWPAVGSANWNFWW
jgi:hypothetical protein